MNMKIMLIAFPFIRSMRQRGRCSNMICGPYNTTASPTAKSDIFADENQFICYDIIMFDGTFGSLSWRDLGQILLKYTQSITSTVIMDCL